MSYIDKEELLKTLKFRLMESWHKEALLISIGAVELAEAITGDVVKVVRCKKCKHYKTDTGLCEIYQKGYCEWDDAFKKPDHFCAYGERKPYIPPEEDEDDEQIHSTRTSL